MRPILLIMWTAFQSLILRDDDNNNNNNNNNNKIIIIIIIIIMIPLLTGKPWDQQSLPHAVLGNEKAKIYWNVPFILEKPPENGANKPGVIVLDKETNIWTLFEGTVCQVDKIAERFKEEQIKYIELCTGIKKEYKSTSVYQINIVFDFLGGHHEQLRNDLRSITNTDKELSYLIDTPPEMDFEPECEYR